MQPKKLEFDFDDESKSVVMAVRQNVLSRILEGQWTARYKGQGMEFSEYRTYVYGDDATAIDWKASLRSGNTLVKEFEEDRSAAAIFLFDVGDSMLFSTRKDGKMKVEYAAELVLFTTKAILKSGHAAGLMMFSDNLKTKIDPNIGLAIEKEFKNKFHDKTKYGGKFNFSKAMQMLLSLGNQRLVIIIVSDFIGMPEGWHKYIEILNQKYEIIGVMIRDHRDRYLPHEGQIMLKDPSTEETIYIDAAAYAPKYHKQVLEEEKIIEKKFKASKADLLKLETKQDSYAGIVKFFKQIKVINK